MYQNNEILIINKPIRVTRKTAIAIDHIITNCFVGTNFKTAIFKSDISDHFPICVFLSPMIDENKNEVTLYIKGILIVKLLKSLIKNSMKLIGMNSKVANIHLNFVKYF